MTKPIVLLLLAGVVLAGCEVRVRDPQTATVLRQDTMSARPLFEIGPTQSQATQVPATVDAPPLELMTNFFEITTDYGTMVVRLYDETPRHRDNFKKLVSERFYDGTAFHRVMPGFMIQGGDPNSKDDDPYNDGIGGPGYTLPAEIRPTLYHRRGALAAARQPDQVNPERRSSGSQFYIVQGRPFPDAALSDIEAGMPSRIGTQEFTFSGEARRAYAREGGAPFLDMQYTVFGELVSGWETLDRISQVATNENDRPMDAVTMTIRPARGL